MNQFIKRAQIGIDSWLLQKQPEVQAEIVMEALDRNIRLLAQTKPVGPFPQFWTMSTTHEPSPWTKKRWARVIRWMLRKKWLRKLVPYPIECLVFAHETTACCETTTLPESLHESVVAQMVNLRMKNMVPGAILVGRKRPRELSSMLDFCMIPAMSPQDCAGQIGRLMDLHLIIHPCMDDTSVLVVPLIEERRPVIEQDLGPKFDEGAVAAAAWNNLMGRDANAAK